MTEVTLTSLAERIDHLESVQAITRITNEYCQALDKRDIKRFLSLWAPDAVFQLAPDQVFEGTDAIRGLVEEGIWPAFAETHHWASNVIVDVDGDNATAVCDVDASSRRIDDSWIRAAATYEDQLVKHQGSWVINRRTTEIHFQEPIG